MTIHIHFYDRTGALIATYDTYAEDPTEMTEWEEWYNNPAVEHEGPREQDGSEAWDQFEVVWS